MRLGLLVLLEAYRRQSGRCSCCARNSPRRFFEAAAGGDMDALLVMLAPDVIFHGAGGGKVQAIHAVVNPGELDHIRTCV